MEKNLGLVIIWTLLPENDSFLENFDKHLFSVKFLKVYNQSGPKFNLELIFAQLFCQNWLKFD